MLRVDKLELLAVLLAQMAEATEMVKNARDERTYAYAEGYQDATKKLFNEISKNF